MHRTTNTSVKPVTLSGSKQFDEHGVIPITVRRTGDIQELRDRYGYNLPSIGQMAGGKAGLPTRTQTYPTTDFWHNYGSSPPVVRLLFTGRLPLNFFTDICYGKKVATPCKPRYRPTVPRETELWEPKVGIKEVCRKRLVTVCEARARHRKRLDQIRDRAQEHQHQVESVLLRQGDLEHRGLSCYLKKMERESERLMRKWKKQQPEDSATLLGECSPKVDVFITENLRHVVRTLDSESNCADGY